MHRLIIIINQHKKLLYNFNVCTYYADINECLISNGGCEFSCTNLEGINNRTGLGYQCGCNDGYQLAPNNHDCIGMEYIHDLLEILMLTLYLHLLIMYLQMCILSYFHIKFQR